MIMSGKSGEKSRRSFDVDRYWNNKRVDKIHGKEDKSSYNCGDIIYKILKTDYWAEYIAN